MPLPSTSLPSLSLILVVGLISGCASGGHSPSKGQEKLIPCPKSPNCIQSEYKDDAEHYEAAILVESAIADSTIFQYAQEVIVQMGGEITHQSQNYLSSTYTSLIFRFVDDFELRLDRTSNSLHLRSASRVGYSDLGVNKKRVLEFKRLFQAKL